jgi:serine/threonine-protein kinase
LGDLMMTEEPWPQRGDAIDHFIVLDRIGEGGFGTVVAAYDPDLDRKVAVKLLRSQAGDTDRQVRLFREAQSMARLSHPNVAAVYEVGLAEDRVFIAMEYVQGVTLRDWLAQEPRSHAEILATFIAAGRGLAAAHAAGIVHRDFKPGNVMVGDDGRPRVVDFGLARSPSGTSMAPLEGMPRGAVVDRTRTGAFVGTPAYCPPEQQLGQATDARSDQFSFCVALSEALSGVHPFAGDTPAEISTAIVEGKRAVSGGSIPPWLRPILERGMQPARKDRFADMPALLHALSRDPKARSRRLLLGLGAAAILSAAFIGTYQVSRAPETLCKTARAELAGVWDSVARERLRRAFSASGRPYAANTFLQVDKQIDEWTQEWIAQHTEACEATHYWGTQSEEVLDLRMICLRRKRGSLRALIGVLAESPNPETVDKAIPAVAALGRATFCGDIEALRKDVLPPEDPKARQAVERFRDRIEDGRQRDRLGRYGEAAAIIAELELQAGSLGYPLLEGEVALLKGQNQTLLGNYEAAVKALEVALQTGLQLDQRDLALRAAQEITYVVGSRMARHDGGLAYAQTALGLSRGLGDEREARSWDNLGSVLWSQGRSEEGEELHRRAIALWERALGPEHPEVATARHNLGYALIYQSKHHEAEIEFRRAVSLRERALGPDHPEAASSRIGLGIALLHQGEYELAEAEHTRAVAAIERSLGPEHPTAATARGRLGIFYFNGGRFEEAEAEYRRALAVREKALGADHPDTLIVEANVGWALMEQGNYREAEPIYRRVLAAWEKASNPEHPDVVWPLSLLGELYVQTGRWSDAKATFQKALSICERASCAANPRSNAQFGMAKVLWREGAQRALALQLAERARQGYARDHLTVAVDDIEEWLHGKRANR